MEEKKKKKKKRKGFGILEIVILAAALGVLGYSAWNLLHIQQNYSGAREEYDQLTESFVSEARTESSAGELTEEDLRIVGNRNVVRIHPDTEGESSSEPASSGGGTDGGASSGGGSVWVPVPFSVDWAGLKAVNQEIVGWIHVDALPHIHYPICKGADNTYYLTHTFRRDLYPSGAIFMDCENSSDFSDASTFVYGHRMDDHSMFGDLRAMENQALVDQKPYFWLYTPEGVFCYQIFSIFEEPAQSDIFNYHFENDDSFLEWAQRVQTKSVVSTPAILKKSDKVLALATCTVDRVRRVLVFGKCISEDKPGPDDAEPEDESLAESAESGDGSLSESGESGDGSLAESGESGGGSLSEGAESGDGSLSESGESQAVSGESGGGAFSEVSGSSETFGAESLAEGLGIEEGLAGTDEVPASEGY